MSDALVQGITRRIVIAVDHPAFAGHFPGQPILPGVALVAEVLEVARGEPTLRALIGAEPRLAVVKFTSPVLPGTAIDIGLRATVSGIEFDVRDGPRLAATGRFVRAIERQPA